MPISRRRLRNNPAHVKKLGAETTKAKDASIIPLVDLKAQYRSIAPAIDSSLRRVVKSQEFVLGPAVRDFEAQFARRLGAKHCIAMQSGTAALWMGLWAAGIGPGDEVITTPLTFFATTEAILLTGAKPVFVDVDPATLLMDLTLLERKLSPRTRAIVPVHLYGQMVDLMAIAAFAKRHNLIIIEDAAQAAGSTFGGVPPGSFSKAAAFSFYPGKNLGTYGDGGALITNDDALAQTARRLRNHGSDTKNHHLVLGFNSRMGDLQAAVLAAKLPHLDRWNEARRRHAAAYRKLLKGSSGLTLLGEQPNCVSNCHLFVVRHQRRNALLAHLQSAGIGAAIHYPRCAHLQPACTRGALRSGTLPVAESAAEEILSLPLYPELALTQIRRVATTVREFCKA